MSAVYFHPVNLIESPAQETKFNSSDSWPIAELDARHVGGIGNGACLYGRRRSTLGGLRPAIAVNAFGQEIILGLQAYQETLASETPGPTHHEPNRLIASKIELPKPLVVTISLRIPSAPVPNAISRPGRGVAIYEKISPTLAGRVHDLKKLLAATTSIDRRPLRQILEQAIRFPLSNPQPK